MAFAFQPEIGNDNPRWSVKVVDPRNAVLDSVPYLYLKETTKATGFPIRILMIVQRFGTDQITLVELIARLMNVCMIEAGFVPVYQNKPALTLEELRYLSKNDKLIRLTDVLSRILDEQGHLSRVKYTFVQLESQESPNNGTPDPVYSSELITLTMIKADDKIQAIATGCNQSMLLNIDCDLFMINVMDLQQKHHALHYVYYGNFDAMTFVGIIKPKFMYPLLDALSAESPDVKGLNDLPEEILEKVAGKLDGQSFVRLMTSSRRNKRVLDKDYLWEIMYKKIGTDFPSYNMPYSDKVFTGVEEVISFKEKYHFICRHSLRMKEVENILIWW